MNLRILYYNGTVFSDYSSALNSYTDSVKAFNMPTNGYLYIGSRLPFNNIYFELAEPNTTSTNLELEYYSDTAWTAFKDIVDETNGFEQSGHVQFTPDLDASWSMQNTNYGGSKITELQNFYINNLYWMRVSVSSALHASTELKFIGNVFSNDEDLGVEFPDLVESSVMTSFKAGKTDWKEQTFKAAELIISDLINRGMMCGAGQILDWRDFKGASVQKVAEIIFKSFGDDQKDDMVDARKEYNERLTKRLSKIDTNKDGVEQVNERYNPQGIFTR